MIRDITILLIIALIMIISISYNLYKIEVQEKFNNMNNRTYELIFADEKLSTDYVNDIVGKTVIAADMEKLRFTLEQYTKSIYAAGNLVSHNTFCQLARYDKWNTNILDAASAGESLEGKLKSPYSLYLWRLDLLASINADNIRQRSFLNMLKSLFYSPELIKYRGSYILQPK